MIKENNEKIQPIKVYARSNEKGEVIKILSSQFDEILETDIFIDEGYGDNFVYPHIRFNIFDINMNPRYTINDKLKGTDKMVLINE